jgi:hypothetical protein
MIALIGVIKITFAGINPEMIHYASIESAIGERNRGKHNIKYNR